MRNADAAADQLLDQIQDGRRPRQPVERFVLEIRFFQSPYPRIVRPVRRFEVVIIVAIFHVRGFGHKVVDNIREAFDFFFRQQIVDDNIPLLVIEAEFFLGQQSAWLLHGGPQHVDLRLLLFLTRAVCCQSVGRSSSIAGAVSLAPRGAHP